MIPNHKTGRKPGRCAPLSDAFSHCVDIRGACASARDSMHFGDVDASKCGKYAACGCGLRRPFRATTTWPSTLPHQQYACQASQHIRSVSHCPTNITKMLLDDGRTYWHESKLAISKSSNNGSGPHCSFYGQACSSAFAK